MLERQKRLHLVKDYQRIWRGGLSRRGKYCVIRRQRALAQTHSRYGFVVSKAVAKRAVVRNKIKRRFRAIVGALPAGAPADVVIYATRQAPTATFRDLQTEITQLLTSQHAPDPHRRH